MSDVPESAYQQTVERIARLDERDASALEDEALKKGMESLVDVMGEIYDMKAPAERSASILRAYLAANPVRALSRIANMRAKKLFDLEGESNSSLINTWFLTAMTGAMGEKRVPEGKLVCEHFIEQGGVQIALGELGCPEFLQHKDDDPALSKTADASCNYISLLFNTSEKEELQSRLGEILRAENFFDTLKPYMLSK